MTNTTTFQIVPLLFKRRHQFFQSANTCGAMHWRQSLSPARDNPGPNMGAICNRDIFLPLLGFESESFGMTAQHSTVRAKGLNH